MFSAIFAAGKTQIGGEVLLRGGEHMLDARLRELIQQDQRLMEVLRAARAEDLPQWYVGAGVIRNLVWDRLHGRDQGPLRDVDLVYFDAADLSETRGKQAAAVLAAKLPAVEWDVVNQASVHLWYEQLFGSAVAPVYSCEEGIATWPETATCLAVRLLPDDQLRLFAPYGVDDLFDLVWRHNPLRATPEQFRRRAIEKCVRQRWPLVTVVERGPS